MRAGTSGIANTLFINPTLEFSGEGIVGIIEIKKGVPIPELPNYSVCKRETVYTIYHVVGIKVGCTRIFDGRTIQNQERYGSDAIIEILDIVSESCGADFAGDVEWGWADWFGYPRANHYSQRWDSTLTKEELSEYGKRGGRVQAQRIRAYTCDDRKTHGLGFENNSWYNGSEKHRVDAAKGAARAAANKTLRTQTAVNCPHCGKTGQTAVMGRWHFDKCPKKPKSYA
jgi:hypothetical protein